MGGVYFCVKHRDAARIYWNFGKNIAAVFLLTELIILLSRGAIGSWLIIVFHFVSIVLATMSGMMLARRMNRPSLPLITFYTTGKRRPFTRSFFQYAGSAILYSVAVCVFTFLFFKFTNPELSSFLKETLGQGEASATSQKVLFSSVVFFGLIALYEEVLFRLFIQTFFSYLFRRFACGAGIAIVITSVLFAIGHHGILSTWWIKFTQTFVVGLILGHLMKKHGMETSFAVHLALNIFALYSAELLIK